MVLSDGQTVALNQLKRIANVENSALRISYVEEKDDINAMLHVDISLDCTHYEHAEGGLALHARESVRLRIDPNFPYKIPSVITAHTRFLGFPHVQWGRILCLYQSTDTQWSPSRGMLGFIKQLGSWLEKAAINELDHPEGPLHPPVAYSTAGASTICIHANTPTSDRWPWFGAALIDERKPGLFDIADWKEVADLDGNATFAPTLLLDFEISFEYPRTIRGLFHWIEKRGVDTTNVLVHLLIAAERLEKEKALHFVIGAPSRGTAGDLTSRLQHLQVWEIKATDLLVLKNAATACDIMRSYRGNETPEAVKKLIDDVFDALFDWQKESDIRWCNVMENRPEIVTRRDKGSAMDWFKEKNVALWGCGALGGQIAEHLVRAGVKRIVLHDDKGVTPGILVRQNFVEQDINNLKTEALESRLKAINKHVELIVIPVNLIDVLNTDQWCREIDIIIDATASLSVRSKLEANIKDNGLTIPVCTMMVSGAARNGVVVLAPDNYSGGTLDVLRRLGLSVMNRPWFKNWVQAFWGETSDEPMRQPEPGCSDPTFVGSNVDVAGLAARMLNRVALELATDLDQAIGCLFSQDAVKRRDQVFRFKPDIVIRGGGREFRFAKDAWRDARGWIRNGARVRTSEDETGGLLFGQFDETLEIAWITNVSGPPANSKFSPEYFICSPEGTQELCHQYKERSNGAVQYIGTWHSHPVSAANPSETDYGGIAGIFASSLSGGALQIMMIVGFASQENAEIGIYAFEKQQLKNIELGIDLVMTVDGGKCKAPVVESYGKSIGLTLSGGGSRAVAFHLGTLRALEDLELLAEVNVISGVSGGSIMTGMLGYTEDKFNKIDRRVIAFLKHGLVLPALLKLIHPLRTIQIMAAFLVVTVPTILLEMIKVGIGKVLALFTVNTALNMAISNLSWPIRRWYSRTHVMADAIEDVVGAYMCDDATRENKSIVFNACELRTGTAFRMSNKHYGSWRYGKAPACDLRIAEAITASAAYPAVLPAYDWNRVFTKGHTNKKQRVIITDGGVFENLGVSVMEPGRDSKYSLISYNPEVIVVSDADAGQFKGNALPSSWPTRMVQVVNSVMRKVQDATKKRLYQYAADGKLERFVHVQLGQIDSKVDLKPSTWVGRDEVMNYPTDFSAMSDRNIHVLSNRGEVITRTLVTQYLLSD